MLIRGFRVSNNESSWFFLFGFTSKTDFYTPILSQERMREMLELSGFFYRRLFLDWDFFVYLENVLWRKIFVKTRSSFLFQVKQFPL